MTKEAAATAGCWNVLVVTGSAAEEVAEFIVFAAESFGRIMLLEAAHTSDSPFDPAMVLFQSIIIRHNCSDATSSLRNLELLAVSSGDRDRGVGSTFGGQAGVSDELRARVVIWPPLRPTWLRCERGSVSVVLPAGSQDLELKAWR